MANAETKEWNRVAVRAVGGLTEVGFSADEHFLLVVSLQGRGLVDTRTGEVVARDTEEPSAEAPWLNERERTVLGIGPVHGTPVPCVGVWGGSLARESSGAEVRLTPTRDEVVLLTSAHARVLQMPVTEVRVAGFSPSGELIVIATSGDIEILRRAD